MGSYWWAQMNPVLVKPNLQTIFGWFIAFYISFYFFQNGFQIRFGREFSFCFYWWNILGIYFELLMLFTFCWPNELKQRNTYQCIASVMKIGERWYRYFFAADCGIFPFILSHYIHLAYRRWENILRVWCVVFWALLVRAIYCWRYFLPFLPADFCDRKEYNRQQPLMYILLRKHGAVFTYSTVCPHWINGYA